MMYVRVIERRLAGSASAGANPSAVTAADDDAPNPRGADTPPHLRVTLIAQRSQTEDRARAQKPPLWSAYAA
jgi:hypothetical protein